MPILQHLCAVELINAINKDPNDMDILEKGHARYHNHKEGYVADPDNNLTMFVVNAGDRDTPEWLKARFGVTSTVLGMSYSLVPIADSRKVNSPIRWLRSVQTFEDAEGD